MIKNDVVEVFNDFHKSGRFIRSLNSTFIVLMVKVSGASNIRTLDLLALLGVSIN